MHTYTEATARWLRKYKKYIQKNYQVIQCGDDVIVRSTGTQPRKLKQYHGSMGVYVNVHIQGGISRRVNIQALVDTYTAWGALENTSRADIIQYTGVDVNDFEYIRAHYSISPDGVITNSIGKVLHQSVVTGGYLTVGIKCSDGKWRNLRVHRLVCLMYHGYPEGGKVWVNHKDTNVVNNRADNLEWCTPAENTNHAAKVGKGVGWNRNCKRASRYQCVTRVERRGTVRWRARIGYGGKSYSRVAHTEYGAAKLVNALIIEHGLDRPLLDI